MDAVIWHRHIGSRDSHFHTGEWGQHSFVTHCNGRWPVKDAIETMDDPPAEERCGACERIVSGIDVSCLTQDPSSTSALPVAPRDTGAFVSETPGASTAPIPPGRRAVPGVSELSSFEWTGWE